MSTSAIGSGSSPDFSTDFQVERLQAQIKDWSTCPTTPPQEKRVIVSRLQTQLDGVESALRQTASTKAAQNPGRIDISA